MPYHSRIIIYVVDRYALTWKNEVNEVLFISPHIENQNKVQCLSFAVQIEDAYISNKFFLLLCMLQVYTQRDAFKPEIGTKGHLIHSTSMPTTVSDSESETF